MNGGHTILCCSIYRQEVEQLNIPKTFPHVKIVYFPGRCGHPPVALEELKATLLGPLSKYTVVDVLSGSLCARDLNLSVDRTKPFHIHGIQQCFHFIANPDIVDYHIREGRHLVTPGWLSCWRQFIKKWGFDQTTARSYFAESSTGILLLDTGTDDAALQNLQDFSEFIDRPYEVISVGLGFLDLFLTNIILQRQITNSHDDSHSFAVTKQKELASYAMALDLLRMITKVRTEDEVIQQVKDMFTMLFGPRVVSFSPVESIGLPVENKIIRQDRGFILPISSSGKLFGTLSVNELAFPEHIDSYLNLASGMVDVCGLAIENARHYQEIKALLNTYGLTSITNRRSFDEQLELEWKRMMREQKPVSVIMCDVDFFKLYNDTYGHQAGDECLREVAKVLALNCRRPGDVAARYGGEEFVLFLPDTQEDGAFFLAESIRQSIEKLEIPHSASPIRHNGCQLNEKDLPLANMGYTVENILLRRRAITKEAGHEKEYHICRAGCT